VVAGAVDEWGIYWLESFVGRRKIRGACLKGRSRGGIDEKKEGPGKTQERFLSEGSEGVYIFTGGFNSCWGSNKARNHT